MEFSKIKPYLIHYAFILELIGAWYLYEHIHNRNMWFMLVAGGMLLVGIFGLLVFWSRKNFVINSLRIPEKFIWLSSFILFAVLLITFFRLDIDLFRTGSGRLLIGFGFGGIAALLLYLSGGKRSPHYFLALILLFLGLSYRIASFLPEIQSSPFSLGWSEGSRFYNASLFLSEKIYGEKFPLPVLHPSRYLMQAFPFLLGVRSILLHRIWQVALWLGMAAWGAYLMAKRVKTGLGIHLALLTGWFFLFFFQGAVYYHLMVCVILVLITYNKQRPLQTFVGIILASIWGGISRINWIPVPALLAVALFLMETPFGNTKFLMYLRKPILWVITGFGIGYGSKELYVIMSGENPAFFDSAFSSALLWDRLLPNATFFLGVLPGILLVIAPLTLLAFDYIKTHEDFKLHWLRWLGLGGILLVFLIGGILVSLKIGGGGDLHNLDGFLVFWVFIATQLAAGKIVSEKDPNLAYLAQKSDYSIRYSLVLLAVLIPTFFAFHRAGFWHWDNDEVDYLALNQIQQAMEIIEDYPGKPLFISERQLVTFGNLKDVKMEPAYEKVFLMEMAMGNNQDYLNGFTQDLKNQTFNVIISDPVTVALQDSSHSFGEENNAWVNHVLTPLLAEYEPVLSWNNGDINLLIPKGSDDLKHALQQLQVP